MNAWTLTNTLTHAVSSLQLGFMLPEELDQLNYENKDLA